jgi:(2Fe-2S) ferredoxin
VKRYRMAVCKGPDCRRNGSDAVYERARAAAPAGCEVYRGGCYGLCHLGPNVVLREDTGGRRDPFSREDFQLMRTPNETYYWQMTPEKISRVLDRHVGAQEVQTDLVGDPKREDDFRNKG